LCRHLFRRLPTFAAPLQSGGLFFSASASKSESGVTVPACDDFGLLRENISRQNSEKQKSHKDFE